MDKSYQNILGMSNINRKFTRKIKKKIYKNLTKKMIKNKNLKWSKIIENKNIKKMSKKKIDKYRKLISRRFIDYIELNIYNEFNKEIKIYGTGSKKLSSDIDLQISLNLSTKWKEKELKKLYNLVKNKITMINNIFNKNIDTFFDFNVYLPSIFFYISNLKGLNGIKKKFYLQKNNNIYNLCLRPNFNIKKIEIINFLIKDITNIFQKEEYSYKKYINESKKIAYILKNISSILLNKNNNNDNLLKLFNFNCNGNDMYYSICTTIFTVWFIQLKNNIPKKDLIYICIPAFIENYINFVLTKKEKYKKRFKKSIKLVKKFNKQKMFINIIEKIKNINFDNVKTNCSIDKNKVAIIKNIDINSFI